MHSRVYPLTQIYTYNDICMFVYVCIYIMAYTHSYIYINQYSVGYDDMDFQLILSGKQRPREINAQIKHSTNTRKSNVVLRGIKPDTKCCNSDHSKFLVQIIFAICMHRLAQLR